ncbi:sigma-70 family RNA polymerase sigma factor [Weissella koreensis]|uniref:Sigma-70 family RNA polymerase sigma factor n=1 Tax=Weissella koreensis TaxID=165096 RepID=A0A7H1MLL2_9LACO|nr:sigma-70 family RNA polymerase sigma factor [Weissella koreensis]AEJ23511.1 hypothetical protein WKK_03185 [Weissella koreensis KACC 15510]AVH75144.1 sigma-70 family RNA polymerase sigma factor [Weissella koreensis]EJF33556.1 hypothetical protein JC2156_09180 [Weissella koreensis KCTC 3621]MCZ9311006.1 sigma-70 family RNA polymerase sigma factor [Weissella koreensis]QGN20369.1 sigma-70 family RNA polymerase sigma factor [Weissella koreensis]
MNQLGITFEQYNRLKANDGTVFLELYQLYRPLIWKQFRQRPAELTEADWRQEVSILLIKTARALAPGDYRAFTKYFQTACWRRIYRLKTKAQNQNTIIVQLENQTVEEILPLGREQYLQILENLLNSKWTTAKLNPIQQQILKLSVEGYKGSEIALMLNQTINQVRTNLMRIRKKIKGIE